MAQIKEIGNTYCKDRWKELDENKFFYEELELIGKTKNCLEYYQHLVNKQDFYSVGNPKNSYVLWVFNKADKPDFNKPLNYQEGRVSLPDIDMDVPGGKRDDIINYLRDKYGHDNVSQMITFGRLQGRSALKEVLRMNEACGFAEMNAMTKPIPDEAAISDQLELMDEEDRGIIKWTLMNNPEDLMQFCHIKEDGSLAGDYAPYFDQAIRLEGTFKNLGKHAAGVVISAKPLYEVCPMLPQKKSDEKIAGLEMNDLEALGHVKFDVLGILLLDKLMEIEKLIAEEESSRI